MDFTIDIFRNTRVVLNAPKDKHVIFWKRKLYQMSEKITMLSFGTMQIENMCLKIIILTFGTVAEIECL